MSQNGKSTIVKEWVPRIVGLTVLFCSFYVNHAVDHDQLVWHEKFAFGVVILFAIYGSMLWIRSTYSPAELKASQESKTVRIFWWILIVAVLLLMVFLTLGNYLAR